MLILTIGPQIDIHASGYYMQQHPLHNGSQSLPRPRATGYTPAHDQHQAQTDLWRSKAYAPSGEIVSLNIGVAYLPTGKAKGNSPSCKSLVLYIQ